MAIAVSATSFEERLAEAVRRSQKYLTPELWRQISVLLEPSALAWMATVTAAWAASHFFGVGEAADAVLVVASGCLLGVSALQVGADFYRFAALVRGARAEEDLEAAGECFARVVALGGIALLSGLLFRQRPRGTFREPFGLSSALHPPPRTPGWFYRPTLVEELLPPGHLGGTTAYGDIAISARLVGAERLETLFHERVHQFFTPKLYFLRDVRVRLGVEGYNRSYLLRYLEEALAEGYALLRVRGTGWLEAMRFPVSNGYVTVAKLGEEAAGLLLGAINVGGFSYRVSFESRGVESGGFEARRIESGGVAWSGPRGEVSRGSVRQTPSLSRGH